MVHPALHVKKILEVDWATYAVDRRHYFGGCSHPGCWLTAAAFCSLDPCWGRGSNSSPWVPGLAQGSLELGVQVGNSFSSQPTTSRDLGSSGIGSVLDPFPPPLRTRATGLYLPGILPCGTDHLPLYPQSTNGLTITFFTDPRPWPFLLKGGSPRSKLSTSTLWRMEDD